MTIGSAGAILGKLIDTVSKGGFYLLNIAPKADGTIPDDQHAVLLEIGAWLGRNGDAIYGTHTWTRFGDGDWRFTVKDGALYAIGKSSVRDATLASVTPALGRVTRVERIGGDALPFTQDAAGLHLQIHDGSAGALPVALKISGLHLP
jgi:alpha-L-fucosidase